eukprot:2424608-Prymnesium_polylepis.2
MSSLVSHVHYVISRRARGMHFPSTRRGRGEKTLYGFRLVRRTFSARQPNRPMTIGGALVALLVPPGPA